ncbi:MAG: 16S rRNA (uracil(1498)-N(3))-methyltransferase [Pseudomonadota bacterium]
MRIPRIHQPGPLSPGAIVELETGAANHVARVLRLAPGAALRLFNGEGGEYGATLHEVGKRNVTVQVGEHHARETESPLAITLAQGIAKGERMDYAIQKATELGVVRVAPVITERCNVRLSDERWEKKLQHWQAVAISACEQCGRNRIPVIEQPLTLTAWLAQDQGTLRLTLDPQATGGIATITETPQQLSLLVGPEGGLSDAELSAAQRAGYRGIQLGPRVLRTETAGIAALAILQARWGDF